MASLWPTDLLEISLKDFDMSLKIQKIDNSGVTYADPSVPTLSYRFKQTEANKSLSGQPVRNHVTEIIINDDSPVVIGAVNANDAVSIRLRVSGTVLSKARIKGLLHSLVVGLDDWSDEDVFGGFRPVTPPVVAP